MKQQLYNVNNIISIEGSARNTNVVINSKINGVDNIVTFDFIGTFEKYIFKTVVYNHIVSIFINPLLFFIACKNK